MELLVESRRWLCQSAALIVLACCIASAQLESTKLYSLTGRLTVVDTTFANGKHRSDYMLMANAGGLYSLICSNNTNVFGSLVSGGTVRVTSTQAPKVGFPWDIFKLQVVTPPPPPLAPPNPLTPPGKPPPPMSPYTPAIPFATAAANTALDVSTDGDVASRAANWVSQWNPGVILNQIIPDPPRVVRDLPTLFILLDLCGKGGGPATTNSSLYDMLFNGVNPMSDYIATCSYGKAQFDQYNTRILNVALPCNGTGHVTRMKWDSNSCSRDNLFNWMYEVEWYIDNELKPKDWNHRRYRHHVIITPPNMTSWAGPDCDWSGMGSIGMAQGTWSYAWVSGDNWNVKQVYLHEIGHNYNLMHAATLEAGSPESCSHCDWSSAMGYCCDTRCLSPPHNFQMGWSKPVADIGSKQLLAGNTLAFELPSQILTDANYLRITTDWLNDSAVPDNVIASLGGREFYSPSNASFLFSYRLEFPNFDEVATGFANGVNVHLFSVATQLDVKDSVHMALLTTAKPAWTDPSGTLVVRQVATSSLAAILTICRPDNLPESTFDTCTDFSDNDCDGLVDAEDPDCAKFYKPSPPPARPPLPRPSPPSPNPRPPSPQPLPPPLAPALSPKPRPVVQPSPPPRAPLSPREEKSPPPRAPRMPPSPRPPPRSPPPPPPDPPTQPTQPSASLTGDIINTGNSRRRRSPLLPTAPSPSAPPPTPPAAPPPKPPRSAPVTKPPPPPKKTNRKKKKHPPPPPPPPLS